MTIGARLLRTALKQALKKFEGRCDRLAPVRKFGGARLFRDHFGEALRAEIGLD